MEQDNRGEPIKGELQAATVTSTATAVPIFNVGSLTARSLANGEYIRITGIEVVTDTAGVVTVFIGADGTIGNGEVIAQGSFGDNGGISASKVDVAGGHLHTIFVTASNSATVTVNLKGSVHTELGTKTRPAWRESLTPGL